MVAASGNKNPIYVVLENIRSAFNVGAFLRTADAAGVEKVYMTGFTPVPQNCPKIAKTSLGAELEVNFAFRREPVSLLRSLSGKGMQIVAVEKTSEAKNIFQTSFNFPLVLVFGHEIDGISREVLEIADLEVLIPMEGTKESLNVSVCGGIAIFETLRKFKGS